MVESNDRCMQNELAGLAMYNKLSHRTTNVSHFAYCTAPYAVLVTSESCIPWTR